MVYESLSRYSLAVVRERARLALQDPAGEAEAVAPLSAERAGRTLFYAELEQQRRNAARSPSAGGLAAALGLEGARGYRQCPAHEDSRASLGWLTKPDGFVLVKCFAGCTYAEIRRAVGL